MPTLSSLPIATATAPTDLLLVEQSGGTNAVTIDTLLAGTQPAIIAPSGTLLGRVSLGAGGPETINVGGGLQLAAGTLSATGGATGTLAAPGPANTVTTLADTDFVAASQVGAEVWITRANMLDGETVATLAAAVAASDTDALAVDQGGPALARQSFSAVWSYVSGKLSSVTQRVVELTTTTVLDASTHNDAILVCSQPLTLFANFVNMGSGFACDVINLSSGNVTMGSGITVGNGNTTLPSQASARLRAVAYSGGDIVFWAGPATSGGGTSPVTAAVTIAASGTATVGTALSLTGTVAPSGDSVGVALSTSNTVAPTSLTSATVSGSSWSASVTPSAAGTYFAWAVDAAAGTHAVSGAITVAAAGPTVTVTFVTAPSGSYTEGQGSVGVNATLDPGTAASGVNFGISSSATVAPASWGAATLINTQSNGDTFWGAFLTMPGVAGTYFAWAETADGAAHTVSAAFTVS
jgi:hypothetical protein